MNTAIGYQTNLILLSYNCYYEITNGFVVLVVYVIMTSPVFAGCIAEQETDAGYGYLYPEFRVFDQIQKRSNLCKQDILRRAIRGHSNNLQIQLKLFYDELVDQVVSGPSGVAVNTIDV